MTKRNLTLSCLALLSVLNVSETLATTLHVQNYTGKHVHLFFRPTNPRKDVTPYKAVIPPTPEGRYQAVKLDTKRSGIDKYFDVVAAQTDGDNPDWKLLGGRCKCLDKNATPYILIDSTVGGLKTSCTTVHQ